MASINDISIIDDSFKPTINWYEFNLPYNDNNKFKNTSSESLGNDFYIISSKQVSIMTDSLGEIKYAKELESDISLNDGFILNSSSKDSNNNDISNNNIPNIGVDNEIIIDISANSFPSFLDTNGNINIEAINSIQASNNNLNLLINYV